MVVFSKNPSISIVIPTLNSELVLESCLKSIRQQNYPQNKIQIIISDGNSQDNTLTIAKNYKSKICQNPLKTAEAGKALGLKNATGKYIAFIDSDNILPTKNWLLEMIEPLEIDISLIGSEPWDFTYRPRSGFIERYSSLIGANDPYAYVIGISDRRNSLNNQWTSIPLDQKIYPKYIKIKLKPNQTIPTIGANGTIFRTSFIKNNFNSDYLFDIDIITQKLNHTNHSLYFAKTKNSIIHTWCEFSILKFYKKQIRRLKDYYQFRHLRVYNYHHTINSKNVMFVLYTILIVPMLFTTIRGYIKKPDIAWAFHPLACIITLYCYVYISIQHQLGFNIYQSRNKWHQ